MESIDTRKKARAADTILCLVVFVLVSALISLPQSKYYDRPNSEHEARGLVLKTHNSVYQKGIFKIGDQQVTVRLLDGPNKGMTLDAVNLLQGNLEMEWFFEKGQIGIVGYSMQGNELVAARMLEPVRENVSKWMFAVFIVVLLFFAGWTGVKAILSFCFTIVAIWKMLLPAYLDGTADPVLLALALVSLLCSVIIFLVAGLNKKGLCAYLGSLAGCMATWIMLSLFGVPMHINGATEGFATTLYSSGFMNLDLVRLFYAGVILSASGAIMDVAMDISAAMEEIRDKKPDISRWELIYSGIRIGRVVIGTMSVTLLLAYSGSALAMLMFMMAKGISLWRIFNMNYLSAEILKTLSGTLGVTLVAPLTALVGGFIFVPKLPNQRKKIEMDLLPK